ncbi:hypothetical protein ASD24_15165 [Paenibacillus sp. Root52]|uniref:hypothetical protein n=1 Tax=Paenibacillus sp. Root52 TaxID=1736552 RepID=UPI0006F24B25|nr:hypothetical protein [Paenibacillus sp. Root52]KQY82792.1 hypothetical protein ASD24_15165 [Paenibacillus sp. Root52]
MVQPTLARSWLLAMMHGILGIGAIAGGIMLIIDPTGDAIGLPNTLLEHSPFANFLIPGILLMLVLGVLPMIIGISLIRHIHSALCEKLNLFPDRYWGWTFSLYTGFALLIWIMAQVYWIQAASLIHLIYFAWGIGIQIVTLLPGIQRRYSQ